MKISVFGLGYVGTVTAACLAQEHEQVIGVDINSDKVAAINEGKTPVIEPKVSDLIREAVAAKRLRATTSAEEAVEATDITLVCVGTPNMKNGSLDLSGVEKVARELGNALRGKSTFHLICVRSTVLPGTLENLVVQALELESGKRVGRDFGLCYNPEFMREGTAVADFYDPPFTVIGAGDEAQARRLAQMYSSLKGEVILTEIRVAEMVKYVCNAFHALKIAFANEIGTIAQAMGVDGEQVMKIVCADRKLNISPAYLKPGFAFGGSCLPKDLRAISYRAKELDLSLPLIDSIMPSNQSHLSRALDAILSSGKKRVGILGLSFKANTDDLRESPMIELVKSLLGEGCEIRIYDPQVKLARIMGTNREFLDKTIPHIGALLQSSLESVLEQSELIVVGRESDEFRYSDLLHAGHTVIHLSRQNRAEVGQDAKSEAVAGAAAVR